MSFSHTYWCRFRKKLPVLISYASLLWGLTACAGRIINDPGHHAVFACLASHPPHDKTLRLYVDSGGNLYPAAPYLPNNSALLRQVGNLRNTEADLSWYFDQPANQAAEKALFAHYGLANAASTDATWDALRQEMARRFALQIDSATSNGRKTLVLLIHGFNVADTTHATTGKACSDTNPAHRRDTTYYNAIRTRLERERPELKSAVWLEMYWDGFQEAPLRIWGAAQASARYAGLALREVLRQTDPATPVRVFTHSAGGVVISQALWNNDAFNDQSNGRYERELRHLFDTIPTPPHRNLRIGMLVPALTSVAFDYYGKRTFALKAPDTTIINYRIVVGQNRRDFAVNKGPAGSETAGATSMGAKEEHFDAAVKAAATVVTNPDMHRVDFCVTPHCKKPPLPFRYPIAGLWTFEAHDWRLYFSRRKIDSPPNAPFIMKEFLSQVLD